MLTHIHVYQRIITQIVHRFMLLVCINAPFTKSIDHFDSILRENSTHTFPVRETPSLLCRASTLFTLRCTLITFPLDQNVINSMTQQQNRRSVCSFFRSGRNLIEKFDRLHTGDNSRSFDSTSLSTCICQPRLVRL